MAKSSKRIRNKKRLGAYLAAGAGSLGMVSGAEAGVISINISDTGFNIDGPNAGLASGTQSSVYNFPVAGSSYFFLMNQFVGYTGFSTGGSLRIARNSGVATDLKVFGNNASIGYGAGNFYNQAMLKDPIFTASDIGANKFLGFRFGLFGNYNYGYLEVTWTSATNTFEIKSAAYESTPNTPILAGSASGGGAVPEPASGAIAALLMGGTALRQWRKKRRQESNEAVAS